MRLQMKLEHPETYESVWADIELDMHTEDLDEKEVIDIIQRSLTSMLVELKLKYGYNKPKHIDSNTSIYKVTTPKG